MTFTPDGPSDGPNGGPAAESLTDAIYAKTTKLDHYLILKNDSIPLDDPGTYSIATTTIEVINGIDAYVELMQKIFDLDQIRDFLSNDFLMAFDALNAVTGPYAIRLFEGLLGTPSGTVRNGVPLEDFGGCHPDPNLTYAKELADLLLKGGYFAFGGDIFKISMGSPLLKSKYPPQNKMLPITLSVCQPHKSATVKQNFPQQI